MGCRESDGTPDGVVVGAFDGVIVGVFVGFAVRFGVGALVGSSVAFEGVLVGLFVCTIPLGLVVAVVVGTELTLGTSLGNIDG